MSESLLRTPMFSWHVRHGGRMVPFAGWEMPVQYESIVQEHLATRGTAGIFDISHMGRLSFDGPAASALLDRLLTRSVARLRPGQIRYCLVLNPDGGVKDDVLVYRPAEQRPAGLMLVVNASNRPKVLDWIESQRGPDESVRVRDRTQEWAMIAVQGPKSVEIVGRLLDQDLGRLKYYRFVSVELLGTWAVVSRTGYTGELGAELIVPADRGAEVWERLMGVGEPLGLRPCGLGARDTLRLEAAMPLYGHEITEEINPLEAGLGFAVDLDKDYFIGRDALVRAQRAGLKRRRVGLELPGRRIARQDYPIWRGSERVGEVTSGTFSPTLERSIAMGLVATEAAVVGSRLEVQRRGRRVPATVVPLPFYQRRQA